MDSTAPVEGMESEDAELRLLCGSFVWPDWEAEE